ncbi:MAG: hypothetical protein WC365_08365 [Candidatus Babeliales bacterium]|jgi:hypothetical protein
MEQPHKQQTAKYYMQQLLKENIKHFFKEGDYLVTDQQVLDREIADFTARLIPFGSRDIAVAVKTALEAGHDGDWAADQIEQYMEDTETSLKNIDPVAVVYESLLQEARSDIESAINKDILNDTNEQVYVYGNCMCTTLDYSNEAQQELAEIMTQIPKEDYTDAMTWLWNNANLDDVKIETDNVETELKEDA